MNVPFLDLRAQYDTLKEEISPGITEVVESCSFCSGPFVASFEEEFAEFCDCKFAIGVGSGTEALWLVLLGLGIGSGDEVITVPNTFAATVEAICMTGAKPVFVDVSEETATMSPELLQRARSAKTKAIIPVHLYGQTADMAPIMGFARSHGLWVVEDAAQAHGAAYGGIKAGSIGDAGCFSFYPGKNLGAYGDAGAIVTDDFDLAERIRALRDHGQRERYHHTYVGWNGRMDGLQGKILSIKLKHLDGWNQHRRRVAEHYGMLLPSEIFRPFATLDGNQHVYHLYVGRVHERDELIEFLKNSGIQCGIHYPIPVHFQKAYEFLGHRKGSFPVSETLAHQILSIPMYPELDETKIGYTCEKISMFYERQRVGVRGRTPQGA